MYGAFICAALNLMVIVFEYYDRREHARNYRVLADATLVSGWFLFGVAMAVVIVGAIL